AGFSAAGSAGGLALASLLWALSASYSATASCQCESDRPSGRPSCTHKWCAISRMRFSRSVIGPPPMSAPRLPRFASGSRQPSSPLPIRLPAVAPPQRPPLCAAGWPVNFPRPEPPTFLPPPSSLLTVAQGNLRALMNMAGELLVYAAEREARQIDEKLFLETCAAPPAADAKAAAARRR